MAKKASSKKVAMVAPPPAKPELFTEERLANALTVLGNKRPYTFIRSHGNSWKVHFLGDTLPTVIKLVNGKPVISKEE
jgi:hypothetical protein